MSDQMRQLSDIKWQATGVDGHTHHTCDTSDAPPVEADEYERMKQRAEAAEAKLKEWETAANNNDPYVTNGGYVEVEVLEAVKRRNLELLTRAEAAERQIVANEARITELTRLKDELAEDASRERQRAEAAELSLKLIEADNRDLIEAHRRIGELERALADEREGHAIDNDEGAEIIINLMGDVQLLTEQLAAAIKRAEAAEAAIAAVPRQAIDALFRQQFGSYPVWFNEMWTPIADWLGYKPARR